MGDDTVALLLTLARENSDLRNHLATAQDMLVETAIDAGHLHARIEAVQAERDAWLSSAEGPPLNRRERASLRFYRRKPVSGLLGLADCRASDDQTGFTASSCPSSR